MKKDKLYGCAKYVLTDDKLKRIMKRSDYKKYIELKQINGKMEYELANKIAFAIKKWALKMGATHYTHWFFPLTGKYAEKQISFIDYGDKGEFISKFNGNALIKGETDASSFPSGGERLTFEARGYTVWDYSSPVFIKTDANNNKVLYIPTAFCTFTGVAVDEKTPLLRATELLNKQTTKMLHLLGYKNVNSVICNVGCEQEYFLVDEKLFNMRKDLMFTGRTLLGANAIKSQETSFHYLGQINSRVSAFMHELNKELWTLGIMAKIQHNEVAPAQHEIVPVYSQANIASDQNSLMMEVMNKVANKHGFKVLFHEKPFNNVNGSGKHNNWSVSTNTGLNLLDYNDVSEEVFMLMFTSVISAIDKHYDLLKMSTSSYSNDMRLGGHEAPPSIISVFVGEDMLEVLNNYVKSSKLTLKTKTLLDIKTSSVAKLYKDNCDRNRTSPFAYTGNKFEFRMVGSMQNISLCNTVLATIVANEIIEINKKLESNLVNKNKVINEIIVSNIKEHSRIIFNGNSYDESWNKEALDRGIVDYNNSVDCYKCLLSEKNIKLFNDCNVLTTTELKVRFDTYMQAYVNSAIIEAKTLIDMCYKNIFPCINTYITDEISILNKCAELFKNINIADTNIEDIVNNYNKLKLLVADLEDGVDSIMKECDIEIKANKCKNHLSLIMLKARRIYDDIEQKLSNKCKPFPNYNDLLF